MAATLTPTNTNEALMIEGYAAFGAGDFATLTRTFASDIRWHVPGKNALAGTKNGREAVFEYFGELHARTNGTFKATLEKVMADDSTVLTQHRDTATRGDRTLDMPIMMRYEVRDGQVVEAWECYHDQTVVDAFLA